MIYFSVQQQNKLSIFLAYQTEFVLTFILAYFMYDQQQKLCIVVFPISYTAYGFRIN